MQVKAIVSSAGLGSAENDDCAGFVETPAGLCAWVIDGEGEWTKKVWYGVRRFFAWLETKAYKMHIRVLLSRYRSYTECSACRGARLMSNTNGAIRSKRMRPSGCSHQISPSNGSQPRAR